ncbi:MAG TPA: metal-dependent hydrolase [Anaeromyxobacter sp.]
MPSVGHVVVGLAAARGYAVDGASRRAVTATFVALSAFPDLDVAARCLGAAAGSEWLHRGALHSLAAAAAAGIAAALAVGGLGRPRWAMAAAGALVAASHGLLDTLTGGGAGVMLLWPASAARLIAWRLMPAAPIGVRIFSPRGAGVVLGELLRFAPLLVYALWPARRGGDPGRTRVLPS